MPALFKEQNYIYKEVQTWFNSIGIVVLIVYGKRSWEFC